MPSDDDLKEHTQHLRAVHFILMSAGLALLFAAYLQPPVNLQTAMQQLDQVQTVTAAISSDSPLGDINQHWVVAPARSELGWKTEVDATDQIAPAITEVTKHNRVSLQLVARDPESGFHYYFSRPVGNVVLESPLCPRDDTIDGFRYFWNDLNTRREVQVLVEIGRSAGMREDASTIRHLEVLRSADDPPKGRLRIAAGQVIPMADMQIVPPVEWDWATHVWFGRFGMPRVPQGVFYLPMGYSPVSLDLQDTLKRLLPRYLAAVPTGEFERSFPDLAEFTRGLSHLRFGDVQTILRSELNRNSERLEVGGISLPTQHIESLGIAILLGIQVYFALHLRAFNNMRRHHLPNIAWVGCYRGLVAYAALLLTAVALPVFTVSELAIPQQWRTHLLGGGADSGFIARIIGATASAAVASWILIELRRLREHL